MALFGRKKEEEKKEAPAQKDASSGTAKTAVSTVDRDLSAVIIKPLITEKAAVLGDERVYTFEVRQDATKRDIRDAVKTIFKVTPRKINVVRRKPRAFVSRMRNRRGIRSGMKKAYVYVKEGDRIDLV